MIRDAIFSVADNEMTIITLSASRSVSACASNSLIVHGPYWSACEHFAPLKNCYDRSVHAGPVLSDDGSVHRSNQQSPLILFKLHKQINLHVFIHSGCKKIVFYFCAVLRCISLPLNFSTILSPVIKYLKL